jgi:hypothetical protein
MNVHQNYNIHVCVHKYVDIFLYIECLSLYAHGSYLFSDGIEGSPPLLPQSLLAILLYTGAKRGKEG